MGKKKDKKKKQGLGDQKTKAKTDAKAKKKKLKEGGDDIDAILNDIKLSDEKRVEVTITESEVPSPRCNATLVAHPTEDKLILFGGEYFNGKVNMTYADLFVFTPAKMNFKLVESPNCPLPRNSHQAVVLPRAGGQMWVFGGEYTSKKGDFRHYRDLWMLALDTMKWEEIRQRGAPSQRSGHRMVAHQNKLFVFGGFYDNGKDIQYYKDLHIFDLDFMEWTKVKAAGQWPGARAGHQFMVHAESNTALLYGGVRSEVLKGGATKTNYLSDTWQLNLDSLKWVKFKGKGEAPSPRAGMTMAIHKERALFFGGVSDIESELDFQSTCHNEVFSLSLAKGIWNKVQFKEGEAPNPRRHAQMIVRGNLLYIFGGVFEQKSKEVTLNDWHSLDLKKLNNWQTLVGMNIEEQEWLGSDDEDEEEKKDDEDDEDDEGDEGDEPPEEMKDDVPLKKENLQAYFSRSRLFWVAKASETLGETDVENSTKEARKLAFNLAKERFEACC